MLAFQMFTLIVGVALLPFVDEKRLLSALEKVYPDLSEEECEYSTLCGFFCTICQYSMNYM